MGKYASDILVLISGFYGASALSLAVSLIPLYIARFLTKDEFIRNAVYLVSIIIVMTIMLFFLNKKTGYNRNNGHDNTFRIFLISGSIALLIYTAIGLLTKFFVILYVQVVYTSLLYTYDYTTILVELQSEHFDVMIIAYLLTLIPLVAASLAGFLMGYRKRAADRDKLTVIM